MVPVIRVDHGPVLRWAQTSVWSRLLHFARAMPQAAAMGRRRRVCRLARERGRRIGKASASLPPRWLHTWC